MSEENIKPRPRHNFRISEETHIWCQSRCFSLIPIQFPTYFPKFENIFKLQCFTVMADIFYIKWPCSVFSFCVKLKVICIRWYYVHLKELVELYIHLSVRKRFSFFTLRKSEHKSHHIYTNISYTKEVVKKLLADEKQKSFADA